jgi:hypothetical protein
MRDRSDPEIPSYLELVPPEDATSRFSSMASIDSDEVVKSQHWLARSCPALNLKGSRLTNHDCRKSLAQNKSDLRVRFPNADLLNQTQAKFPYKRIRS